MARGLQTKQAAAVCDRMQRAHEAQLGQEQRQPRGTQTKLGNARSLERDRQGLRSRPQKRRGCARLRNVLRQDQRVRRLGLTRDLQAVGDSGADGLFLAYRARGRPHAVDAHRDRAVHVQKLNA